MPRSAGTIVENNFVNGLITEATGMNFPENACTSASNVIFKETGEVTRRLGYDYETVYQLNTVTRNNSAIVEYEWKAAGGDGNVDFVVQQIGGTIYFYRVSPSNSLSAGLHATSIALSTFAVSGAPSPNAEPCSFSYGKGFLFVTNKYCEPFYVTYSVANNTLVGTAITVKIRDLEGQEDGLSVDERPSVLSDTHNYNLRNQGWGYSVHTSPGPIQNPITYWDSTETTFPSNADQWWLFKDASDIMTTGIISRFAVGNSPAPKGYYILNAFSTNRSTLSGVSNLTESTSGSFRPSCTAFFAGRVWYAGVEAQGYVGDIYYSQIIERNEQIGQCYQINDPTSEVLSDLLDTDGGVARVLDMGTVYRMFATQKVLVIFASNGIWTISGSDVASFKATDYTIKKVASIPVASGLSIVDATGSPVFWTEDGIWTIAYQGGEFTVVSLSDKKIKQYFKDIPRESKKWAKGAFNNTDKLIQWVFSSTEPDTIEERYTYDSVLTLNTTTGAFYPWTIYSATKSVNGIISCAGPSYGSFNTVVDASGNTVIDASGNTVVTITSAEASGIRFFTTKNTSGTTYSSTWSVSGDTRYLDWVSDSESYDYTSTFTSGYRIHADANREYQANYVTFYCTDDTNSSAFVQGLWDFSNNTLSKKWTTAQQIYNSTPTYRDYRIRKIKIRGWGKALNFKIYGATGVPFSIVGWSAFETANPLP